MMDLSKSYDFFKPEMLKGKIHIIGCGSVGSTVAENLARFGITDLVLYDFDVVEPKNIVNQMFTEKHIGKPKVDALEEMLKEVNADMDIKKVADGWHGQKLAGYVFLCVDDIEIRKQIVLQNKNNNYIKGMFDFRTRLTDAQHYAADWSDKKMVENFFNSMNFTHDDAKEETPTSACGVTLSVAPTIRLIVGYGVQNFIEFVKENKLRKLILVDALNFSVEAF